VNHEYRIRWQGLSSEEVKRPDSLALERRAKLTPVRADIGRPQTGSGYGYRKVLNQLVGKLVYFIYNTAMKTVGAFDAKTHLNELLHRASKGETIRITRRGVPVAKLIPPGIEKEDACSLIEAIRQLRKGTTLGKTTLAKITIRELIDEGRRY
jgi:prevent-host-death family protein